LVANVGVEHDEQGIVPRRTRRSRFSDVLGAPILVLPNLTPRCQRTLL